jgi:hypothetical protein
MRLEAERSLSAGRGLSAQLASPGPGLADRVPSAGRVLAEQVAVAVRSQRLAILVWTVVAVPFLLLGVLEAAPLFLLALVAPLVLWRREPPSRRGAMWASPVPRGRHAALRLGGAWLVLVAMVVAYLMSYGIVGLAASHEAVSLRVLRYATPLAFSPGQAIQYAAHALLSVTTVYLLVSALAVRFEKPAIPTAIALWVLLMLFMQTAAREPGLLEEIARSVVDHLSTAMVPGRFESPAVWLPTALLWLALGLATCTAATVTHREPEQRGAE